MFQKQHYRKSVHITANSTMLSYYITSNTTLRHLRH